jgi:hypothetical protein
MILRDNFLHVPLFSIYLLNVGPGAPGITGLMNAEAPILPLPGIPPTIGIVLM